MSLKDSDAFLVPSEAIGYIEAIEKKEGTPLAKVEIIEYFFEWLRKQPRAKQIEVLREVLSE